MLRSGKKKSAARYVCWGRASTRAGRKSRTIWKPRPVFGSSARPRSSTLVVRASYSVARFAPLHRIAHAPGRIATSRRRRHRQGRRNATASSGTACLAPGTAYDRVFRWPQRAHLSQNRPQGVIAARYCRPMFTGVKPENAKTGRKACRTQMPLDRATPCLRTRRKRVCRHI